MHKYLHSCTLFSGYNEQLLNRNVFFPDLIAKLCGRFLYFPASLVLFQPYFALAHQKVVKVKKIVCTCTGSDMSKIRAGYERNHKCIKQLSYKQLPERAVSVTQRPVAVVRIDGQVAHAKCTSHAVRHGQIEDKVVEGLAQSWLQTKTQDHGQIGQDGCATHQD